MGLYEYALSSPWRYLDPGGMKCGECCPPFDEKDNHYIVSYEWAITPGSVTADPDTTDAEVWKESLTPVEVAEAIGSVGTGAAGGFAGNAGKSAVEAIGGAIGGAIEGGIEVGAGEAMPTNLKDACFEGAEKAKRKFNETGSRGGVKAWVKIYYKKCEACFGYIPVYEALGADYEWKHYEWGWYQCSAKGKPYSGREGPSPFEVGPVAKSEFGERFAKKDHADQHKGTCLREAEVEFEASNP